MRLEHYPPEKLKEKILEILKNHPELSSYRVFFFGSRVRGDNFPSADIDIGIEGPKEVPPGIKLQLEEELDRLPILYKVDLVDFSTVSEKFRMEALKSVEYVR